MSRLYCHESYIFVRSLGMIDLIPKLPVLLPTFCRPTPGCRLNPGTARSAATTYLPRGWHVRDAMLRSPTWKAIALTVGAGVDTWDAGVGVAGAGTWDAGERTGTGGAEARVGTWGVGAEAEAGLGITRGNRSCRELGTGIALPAISTTSRAANIVFGARSRGLKT